MDPESKSTRPKFRACDLVRLGVVLGCVVGGILLRLQPQPTSIVGGGLIVFGIVLFAYWAKRPPRP